MQGSLFFMVRALTSPYFTGSAWYNKTANFTHFGEIKPARTQ